MRQAVGGSQAGYYAAMRSRRVPGLHMRCRARVRRTFYGGIVASSQKPTAFPSYRPGGRVIFCAYPRNFTGAISSVMTYGRKKRLCL